MAMLCHYVNTQAQCYSEAFQNNTYAINQIFLSFSNNQDCAEWHLFEDIEKVSSTSFHRTATTSGQLDLMIPSIPNQAIVKTLTPIDGFYADVLYNLDKVSIQYENDPSQSNNNALNSNDILSFNLEKGYNTFLIKYELSFPGKSSKVIVNGVSVFYQVNDSSNNDYTTDYTYESPDEVWTITIDGFDPPCSNVYPDDPNHPLHKYTQNTSGSARAYVKLGDNNDVLTRPLIFVEGIDFSDDKVIDPESGEIIRYGGNGWDNIIQGVDTGSPKTIYQNGEYVQPKQDNLRNYPGLINDLTANIEDGEANYDIIIVDFEDGADYIQKSGEILIELINKVNERKVCGYDNVLTGISMGGQVARYALAKMEIEGEDHQTRMYISFDSPHLGANIPLALQSIVWFITQLDIDLVDVGEIADAWNQLNRPGAIQMLFESFYDSWSRNHISLSLNHIICEDDEIEEIDLIPYDKLNSINAQCLRQNFKYEMNQLGFPKETYNVAISNGSGNGENQGFSAGQCLLGIDIEYDWSLFADEINDFIDDHLTLELNSLPNDNSRIVDLRIPYEGGIMHFAVNKSADIPAYDSAPGCKRYDVRDKLYNKVSDLKKKVRPIEDYLPLSLNIECVQYNTCFMPTNSVVAYETNDIYEKIENALVDVNLSPFDEIHFPSDGMNEPHVEVNVGNIEFVKDVENDNLPDQPNTLPLQFPFGRGYNFGLYHKKIGTCDIYRNGELHINKYDYSSYLFGEKPHSKPFTKREHFVVTVKGYSCDSGPADLTVHDGGKLILGDQIDDNRRSGELVVPNESTLVIREGGLLKLNKNSILRIKEGGEVTLSDFSQIVLGENAQIIVEDGGVLNLYSDAMVDLQEAGEFNGNLLEDLGSSIVVEGQLNVLGARLETEGAGYFSFREGGTINVTGGSALEIYGHGQEGDPFIHIDNGEISLESKGLIMRDCKVKSTGAIRVFNRNTMMERVDLEGGLYYFENNDLVNISDGLFTNISHLDLQDCGTLNVNSCKFDYAENSACIVSENSAAILLRDVEFTDQLTSLWTLDTEAFVYLEEVLIHSNRGTYIPSLPGHNGSSLTWHYNGPLVMKGTRNLFIKSSEIIGRREKDDEHNRTVGIFCEDPTNVFLLEGTSIAENYVGIYMNGSEDLGMVHMECSELLNNFKGIKGFDILLSIDAYQNAVATDGQLRSNSFISTTHGIQNMFEICYLEREITADIPATGNYWRNDNAGTAGDVNYSLTKSSNGTCPGQQSIALDINAQTTLPPEECPGYNFGGGDDGPIVTTELLPEGFNDCVCFLNPNPPGWNSFEWESTFNGTFANGIVNFLFPNENYNDYQSLLEYWNTYSFPGLTDIRDLKGSSFYNEGNKYLKLKVDVANAIVDGECTRDRSAEFDSDLNNEVLFYPNPTRSLININLEGLHSLEFLNVLGESVFKISKDFNQGTSIDISDLNSGLYYIKLLDSNNFLLTTKSFIKID